MFNLPPKRFDTGRCNKVKLELSTNLNKLYHAANINKPYHALNRSRKTIEYRKDIFYLYALYIYIFRPTIVSHKIILNVVTNIQTLIINAEVTTLVYFMISRILVL